MGLALAFCFTACYDLDKMPEGVLSTAEPFRSTGEIRNYIDRYYEFGVRTQGFMAGGGGGIAVMMLTVIIWHLLLSIRA